MSVSYGPISSRAIGEGYLSTLVTASVIEDDDTVSSSLLIQVRGGNGGKYRIRMPRRAERKYLNTGVPVAPQPEPPPPAPQEPVTAPNPLGPDQLTPQLKRMMELPPVPALPPAPLPVAPYDFAAEEEELLFLLAA